MPHPADHPAVALAIMRSLPGQLQKAKMSGDTAAAQAIEAALVRDRSTTRTGPLARATSNHTAGAAANSPAAAPAPAATSDPVAEAATAAAPAGTAWTRGW
jgi:hypothetical protein